MTSLRDYLKKKIRDYGIKFRSERISPFLAEIKNCHQLNGEVRILDIGGTREFWDIVDVQELKGMNVKITLVNVPGAENRKENDDIFIFAQGDGCNLEAYKNVDFHLVHSNSVIEHVGDWQRMKMFAGEVNRLGQGYSIQTPNFWFPIEPHFIAPFFHWLPKVVRVWIMLHTGLGHHQKAKNVDEAVQTVESARLLNTRMLAALFPEAEIRKEKFLFLTKSLTAIKHINSD
jgi:hypothetical protein